MKKVEIGKSKKNIPVDWRMEYTWQVSSKSDGQNGHKTSTTESVTDGRTDRQTDYYYY